MSSIALTGTLGAGLCLDCNYPLQGLPSPRCPECGREFDPADPETFNPGRSIAPWASWAVGPISMPVYGAAVVAIVITVWWARLPGEELSWRSPLIWGWLALAAVWLAWPAVRRGVLAFYGWPPRTIRPMRRNHWVIPLLMAAMVVTIYRQLPRRLAFRRSEAAMKSLADKVMAAPRQRFENQWVGVFYAKHIRALPGGFRFTAQDDDVSFKSGFEFMPALNPRTTNFHGYRYLGDGWWSWREQG